MRLPPSPLPPQLTTLHRINLPIGGLTLFVIVFFLPLKRVRGDLKKCVPPLPHVTTSNSPLDFRKFLQIDYFGAFLTIVGTTLVLLPLNWGGTSFEWVSGPVLGCLFSGLLVFVLLFVWEWKFAKIPIVPRALLFCARRLVADKLPSPYLRRLHLQEFHRQRRLRSDSHRRHGDPHSIILPVRVLLAQRSSLTDSVQATIYPSSARRFRHSERCPRPPTPAGCHRHGLCFRPGHLANRRGER